MGLAAAYRWLLACFGAMLLAFLALPSAVLAEEPLSAGSISLREDPFVVASAEGLVEGQRVAGDEARRMSPEAVAAREVSATAYEGWGPAAAERLVRDTYPRLLDELAGGPPRLPVGATATGFPNGSAMSFALADGKHAVVQSVAPLAVEVSPGRRVPVDLELGEAVGGYEPKMAPANARVRIPKMLGEGAALVNDGITMAPVDGSGRALAAAQGVIDGAAVFYGDSEAPSDGAIDMDTLVKPTSMGFEQDILLRSARSPEQLRFRVSVPAGEHLEQLPDGTVNVTNAGRTVAFIPRPSAVDVEGATVPVSLVLSGDVLDVSVPRRADEYRYPVLVDPSVVDSEMWPEGFSAYNWAFLTDNSSAFWKSDEHQSAGMSDIGIAYTAGQYGEFFYKTQKESHIYRLAESVQTENPSSIQGWVLVASAGAGTEAELLLAQTGSGVKELCLYASCVEGTVTSVNKENRVYDKLDAVESGPSYFKDYFTNPSVYILQEKGPSARMDTSDSALEGAANPLYANAWANSKSRVGVATFDPGIGDSKEVLKSASKPGWSIGYSGGESQWPNQCVGVQCNECHETTCSATGEKAVPVWFTLGAGLPDGEDTIEAEVEDGVGLKATAAAVKLKFDNTGPHNLELVGLPASHEIGDGVYQLTANASDGTAPTPSSGVLSIALKVDGVEVGKSSGRCSPGPCTAKSSSWAVKGLDYGVGQHTFTVVATDIAGNVATENLTVTVHHASPLSVGPVQVDPVTGEASLGATDVSMGGPGGSLAVSRSYNSEHLSAGASGPMGGQWSMSLSGQSSLTENAEHAIVLTSAMGGQTTFTSLGSGKYRSPTGDTNLSLTEKTVSGKRSFVLSNASTSTSITFSLPGTGTSVWKPTIQEGPVSTETVTFAYQTVEVEGVKVIQPTEALAPVPAGVSCSPTLSRGCRALTFNYATTTTATGEGPTEWGDYNGHLTRAYFTAWDPATSAMTTTTVAQYSYDKQGRLRAVWDPRVSPALKTTYGYDSEGRVTVITSPGQQPWILRYGTALGDSSTGRVLSVERPSASTPFGSGLAPANTVAPTLSASSPSEGQSLNIASNGTWTNSPLVYGYQWERCSLAGGECTPIPGAVNQAYTTVYSDEGHTVAAVVTATNAGGTVAASTLTTKEVPYTYTPTYSSAFGTVGTGAGQLKSPSGIAFEPEGGLTLIADTANNRVQTFTAAGAYHSQWGSEGTTGGKFKGPKGIATAPFSPQEVARLRVYVTDTGNNRVEYSLLGAYFEEFGVPGTGNGQFKSPTAIAFSPVTKDLYVLDTANNRVQEFTLEGGYLRQFGTAGTEGGQLNEPKGIAVDSAGDIWVADTGNNRVQEFSSSGTYISQFGTMGSGNGQFKAPAGIAVDGKGNVWVADTGNNRIQYFTEAGVFEGAGGAVGTGNGQFKEPAGIAIDGSENVYVADTGNNRIQKWGPISLPADSAPSAATPPSAGSLSITTLEYKVPVSGTGAPHTMSATELEKWAQMDVPTEATAIYPPDEPMGWPAQDYKRATIVYLDELDRVVNTASPLGGIATTEYNGVNDVVRSLTPDNREAALKEGAKSSEVAKLLDSESTYNGEGTELLSSLGPQHTIKLANGSEKQARRHTIYSYDEGAPSEGGPYRLVTKVSEGAQITGEAEQDIRTTVTSYAGQNGLGWILRKPTSVTTDPTGLKLVRTTVYDPTTGNVVETRTPAAGPAGEATPTGFLMQWGSLGTGNGQFSKPAGTAVDSEGNVWVADTGNNRVQEFSSAGTYVRQITGLSKPQAVATDTEKHVWISDTGKNVIDEYSLSGTLIAKYGSTGELAFLLSSPGGLAVGSGTAPTVYVVDPGSGGILAFRAEREGVFSKIFGETGTGNGQLKEPGQLTLDATGNLWLADTGNNRIQEFSASGTYKSQFGTLGSGNGQLSKPKGVALDPEGHIWVSDTANNRLQEFTAAGTYMRQTGSVGTGEAQMKEPGGLAFDSTSHLYVADTGNNRIQKWISPELLHESSGTGGTHGTQTIYYSASVNSTYPACGSHSEWANLPCQTQPAAQPNTSGVPNLPVFTVTYNVWDEPEKATSTQGANTRTTTSSHDGAGRLITSSISANVGTALPAVKDEYSSETGMLVKQTTTVGETTQELKSIFNTLGQLVTYTDADGNTTSYEYESQGDDRLQHVDDGKGTQSYTYDETTGAIKELADSAAGKFTAVYDIEGNLTGEGYPNAMSANYTLDATGEATSMQYVKTSNCATSCPETWFSDTVIPSIHGQWLSQTSSLSTQTYTYDNAGRLTRNQQTPAGKGCITSIYAYDEETNRLSVTTRQPDAEGKCATEGGTVENHTYDPANRLIDTGTGYDGFGNTTKLSAADAGGSEVTSNFYDDNQLASQSQAEETVGYNLDPGGRTREATSTGKIVATEILHYAGPGATPSWIGELSTNWTRDIAGIGSGLVAVQHNGETPVLQLSNLHGDIIATATDSETATTLASTIAEASPYGVPGTEAPPKYAWLGAHELPTTLPSGITAMGARSYIPQLGRFLQTDPVPGGSANAYTYTYGDPINSTDLTGEYTLKADAFDEEYSSGQASQAANTRAAEIHAAEEAAIREEAERKAAEAAEQAAAYAAFETEGEYEEESEEYGMEYAAFGPGPAKSAPHMTEEEAAGVYVQSLEEGKEAVGPAQNKPLPLCAHMHEDHPCSRYVCFNTGHNEYYGHKGECVHGRVIRVRSRGAHRVRGRGQVRHEHGSVGCFVGAVGGAVFATFSTAGLEAPTGAIAGCAIGAGIVELFG